MSRATRTSAQMTRRLLSMLIRACCSKEAVCSVRFVIDVVWHILNVLSLSQLSTETFNRNVNIHILVELTLNGWEIPTDKCFSYWWRWWEWNWISFKSFFHQRFCWSVSPIRMSLSSSRLSDHSLSLSRPLNKMTINERCSVIVTTITNTQESTAFAWYCRWD